MQARGTSGAHTRQIPLNSILGRIPLLKFPVVPRVVITEIRDLKKNANFNKEVLLLCSKIFFLLKPGVKTEFWMK